MKFFDVILPTAEENLALDEAILEEAEAGYSGEALRLWESPEAAVIVGRASRVAEEVQLTSCRERRIPVLRRCSGGAAVVIGPGCLVYSVVLSYERRPELRPLEAAHQFVLGRLAAAVGSVVPDVKREGISDLVVKNRKFSGNSLRCKRNHFLYHGTLLYGFSIETIASCLRMPARRPDYRCDRDHSEFVTNLSAPITRLRHAIADVWNVDSPSDDWPRQRAQSLYEQRYANQDWHERR